MPRSRKSKVVIGMIHLLPLPGSPRYAGDVKAVRGGGLRDAAALHEAA
jgi:predicted TIM-barrel enzyme